MVHKLFRQSMLMIGFLVVLALGYWLFNTFSTPRSLVQVPAQPEATTTAPQVAAAATVTATSGQQVAESQKSGISVDAGKISQQNLPPPGYVEYKNDTYGFSFYHLPEGKVTEFDEGGGAMTVVLENLEKVRGMQVFIVPYNQPLITEERFHKDVPSGVRKNVEDAMLDGVRAVTFNSIDEVLGETREIWVIRNGYLYEITTFSGVGNWFIPIIQSWDFF